MGKPWKKRDTVVSPDAPVDYKWSSQSYTLKEILSNFKLPVVVQCREDTYTEHVQNFFFELRQPIMLHNKRTIRKIFARCIRKGEGGTVKELLPEVVIPEDYAGWFKLSKGLTFDKPSPHQTIHSLTKSSTEFFLCTTNLNGLVLPDDHTGTEEDEYDDDEEHSEYVRPINEGEVLRKTGIQKINQMMLPESLRSNSVDNRYLMCIDEHDNEFFIPLGQDGLFYEVSDGKLNKNDNSILQIPDILDEMVELPLYVRHILGDPPPVSKFYSPCLKLVRIKEEETVMGASLEKGEEILPLEIQTNSPIKFEIALNTPMLQNSLEYIEAIDLCDTVSQSYLTDMKLAVNFKVNGVEEDLKESKGHNNPMFEPEVNEFPESVCNSQRTSSTGISEYGDTEANSEFSIQWNPTDLTTTSFRFANECAETDTDCLSIESINEDNFDKFNEILGGYYVQNANTEVNPDDYLVVSELCGSESDVDSTLKKKKETKRDIDALTSYGDVLYAAHTDVRERISDCSMQSNHLNRSYLQSEQHSPHFARDLQQFDPLSEQEIDKSEQDSDHVTALDEFSSPRSILTPPSPFKTTMSSSLNSLPNAMISNSSHDSSTLTICSDGSGSRIDLKDHFPRISSSSGNSSCESVGSKNIGIVPPLDLESNPEYTFTGDVFINHDENDKFDGDQWGNRFKVIKSKDLRNHDNRKKKTVLVKRPNGRSMSDDLINFEDFNRTNNVRHANNGIITCKVADEMMSSYNDLRLSLEESTKTARNMHTENQWNDFCFARSSSLPVRSKQVEKNQPMSADEYSQSWEQISPRPVDDVLVGSGQRSRDKSVTSKTLKHLNSDMDSNGDDTRLLSDTSSEESGQLSHRSFTSEGSDISRDLFTNFLPGSELFDRYGHLDVSVQKGHTLTRDKSKLAQRMKVKKEIQRKKRIDWNEEVVVI